MIESANANFGKYNDFGASETNNKISKEFMVACTGLDTHSEEVMEDLYTRKAQLADALIWDKFSK